MSDDALDEMMANFARAAVELARDFNVPLDFTEESLEQVEAILAQLHQQLRTWGVGKSSPEPCPNAEQIDSMCKLWGGYFCEVVRRRWGGDWALEPYPGRNFSTLVLNVRAGKLFPTMKVYRRLTEGHEDNLWEFYQTLRKKMEASPGGKVQ